MKLSIVQLVGCGGVSAECAACLLLVAAADSRHRLVTLMLYHMFVMLGLGFMSLSSLECLNYS